MNNDLHILKEEAVAVLKDLIRLPSFSKEEWQTASAISKYLAEKGLATSRVGNNVFAVNKYFDAHKPTILLVSHHDTVKPNTGYTKDPFQPLLIDEKLYGLGSNDAGAAMVSLMSVFVYYYDRKDLQYNLALAAVGEEEISGPGGIESILSYLPTIDCAIVGEPTGMQMAVAERGLVVLDVEAIGKAGHAAREEGENAIYKALADIERIKALRFEKISPLLGPVKLSVTVIETQNKAHNTVPDRCRFVIDARVNELYTLEEVNEIIRSSVESSVTPRSLRLRSTVIADNHPLVVAGKSLGLSAYGSPTTSDKALLPCPALKLGPGDSARSHTADEYIYLLEITEGIDLYIKLLNQIL